jgi:hypothetical protein
LPPPPPPFFFLFFLFQDSDPAYTTIQDTLLRPVNNPSTSQLLQALGGATYSDSSQLQCTHLTTLTVQFLRARHNSSVKMTPHLDVPIGIHYYILPPTLRLFVHLVNHKWAFCRYSEDLSKFHCLSCRTSSHCRHWFDFEQSDLLEAAEINQLKFKKVQAEIAAHVDDMGALRSTGISKGKYALYTAEQKAILQDREGWLLLQLRQQISSITDDVQSMSDAIESFSDITAHVAKLGTVLELQDPDAARRGCSCGEDLIRKPEAHQAVLLCNRKFFNVRCITFHCPKCGVAKQYVHFPFPDLTILPTICMFIHNIQFVCSYPIYSLYVHTQYIVCYNYK